MSVSLRTVDRACALALATVRFATAPGEQMQIDFGSRRLVIGGVIRK